jgi:hypothetical protein
MKPWEHFCQAIIFIVDYKHNFHSEKVAIIQFSVLLKDSGSVRDYIVMSWKIDHNIDLSRAEGSQTFFGGNRRLPFEFTNYASFQEDEQFLYAFVKSIEIGVPKDFKLD